MNDKLVAGIVTAAWIAPLCTVCILGPAVVGSALAAASVWLGGAGPLLAVALALVAGLLVYRTLQRRHEPTGSPGEDQRSPHDRPTETGHQSASRITPATANAGLPPKIASAD